VVVTLSEQNPMADRSNETSLAMQTETWNFSIPLTTSVKKFKDFSNRRKEHGDN